MSICLYCLGKKAFVALKALDASLINTITQIVIAKDPNIVNDYAADIKMWAENNNVPFVFKSDLPLNNTSYSVHITLGWRWLLNTEKGEKVIVFHDSLLPKYRGYNPLVTALINGDTEIGATCFLADEGIDTGSIILQKKANITFPIKIAAAINTIADLYADMLCQVLKKISGTESIAGVPQHNADATYSLWRDEHDYLINWQHAATVIKRFIDATGYPYNGAFFYYSQLKIRITDAVVIDDVIISNRDAGKVFKLIDGNPVVVCGNGLLLIKEMKTEHGEVFKIKSIRTRLSNYDISE